MPVRRVRGVDDLADENLEQSPVREVRVQRPVGRGVPRERCDESSNATQAEVATPKTEEIGLVVAEKIGFDCLAMLSEESDEA